VKEGNPARYYHRCLSGLSHRRQGNDAGPASGSVFALLPPQNATGNWVKVVQRIPVRLSSIRPLDRLALRAGMSVKISIDTGHQRSLGECGATSNAIFGADMATRAAGSGVHQPGNDHRNR